MVEPSASSPRVGTILKGKYRLESLLGIGGMAEVYCARNMPVDRVVAIKILRREMAARPEAVERFMREAKAAGAVRHRNIVDVLDIDTAEDGVMFIVQEYLEGEDLAARIKRRGGCLEPSAALDILLPVAEAVGFAHDQGIVHRDLKPDNVFIAENEEGEPTPKVLDFGISKLPLHDELRRNAAAATAHRLTAVGAAMGTPYYMSPEQIRDPSTVDAGTDVWSLGVVLYETLAGRMPFDADELHELFGLISSGQAQELTRVAPKVPAALARVVHRCLSADPSRRYPNGAAVATALRRVRASLELEPAPISQAASRSSSGRKHGRKNSGRFPTYDPNRDPRAQGTASIPSGTSAPPPASDPPPADRLPSIPDLELELDLPPKSATRPLTLSSPPPVASEPPPEREDALPSGMQWDEDEGDDPGIELAAAPDVAIPPAAPPAASGPVSSPPVAPSARSPVRLATAAASRRVSVRRHVDRADPVTWWRGLRSLALLVLVAVVATAARYGSPAGLPALQSSLGPIAPMAAAAAALAILVGALWVGLFALRLPSVALFVASAALLVCATGSGVVAALLASPGLLPVTLRKAALVASPWAACLALVALIWFAVSYARDLARLEQRRWAAVAYAGALTLVAPTIWLARMDFPAVSDAAELEVGLTPAPAIRAAHQLGVVLEGARALPPPTPLPVDGAPRRGAGALGGRDR